MAEVAVLPGCESCASSASESNPNPNPNPPTASFSREALQYRWGEKDSPKPVRSELASENANSGESVLNGSEDTNGWLLSDLDWSFQNVDLPDFGATRNRRCPVSI
eukprot:4400119-Prorocentrum_lima.AAC.1